MKFLLKLTFFLSYFFLINTACAATIEEYPNILQIDFYPNGAMFTFECKTDIEGNFEIVLPSSFTQITEWRTIPIIRPGWIPPSLLELETEIQDNKDKMNLFDAKISSLVQTIKLLGEMQIKETNFDNFIYNVMEAQSENERAALEISSIKEEREKLKVKLDALTEEFNSKLPGNHDKAIKIVGKSDAYSTVRVEAYTNAAQWSPEYRFNLNTQTGKIDAKLYVHAVQRTGFDAIATPIRFHTNNPERANSVPKLLPQIVDIRPKIEPVARSRAVVYESATLDYLSEPQIEFAPRAPQMISGLISVVIDSEGDIKGDGIAEEISLGQYLIDSTVSLVSIPEYGKTVYLIAKTAPLKIALIGSNAKFYVDGNASANFNIKNFGEGEEAELTFGTAPLVNVEKKNIISKSDSSWWGSSGYLNDGYTIEIMNGMPTQQTITVKDRIPISANSKILVKDIKYNPTPKEITEDNLLTWEIKLNPGEKSEISVNYTLEFPSAESLIFK